MYVDNNYVDLLLRYSSVCDVKAPRSHRLGFFDIDFMAD